MSLLINLFLFEPLVLSCYWHLWLSEQKAQVLSQSFVRWLPLVLTSGLLCAPSMEWKSAALQKGSSRGTIEIMEFKALQPHVILIKKKYICTAFMINLEINKEDVKNAKTSVSPCPWPAPSQPGLSSQETRSSLWDGLYKQDTKEWLCLSDHCYHC